MDQFLFLAICLGCLTAFESLFLGADPESLAFINILGPVLLAFMCLSASYSAIRINRSSILFPIVSALIASAFYYGLGPLFYLFADEVSYAYSQAQFEIDGSSLLETNLLNAAFLFFLLVGYLFSIRTKLLGSLPRNVRNDRQSDIQASILLAFCLLVGGSVKYFVMNGSFKGIESILKHLTVLLDLSVAPAAFLAVRGKSVAKVSFALLSMMMFVIAILTFSKTAFMRSILMCAIGLRLGGAKAKWMTVFAFLAVFVFMALTTPISNLRQERNRMFGRYESSLYEHAQILLNLIEEGTLFQSEMSSSSWIQRFNYAPAQAFAIYQYNQGKAGDSYKNALWIFVPRIIYPDKPSMTEIGVEFSTEFNGNQNNSVSIGIAGEAYYNGGFLGLFFVGSLLGLEFAIFEKIVSKLLVAPWVNLPCFILIVLMGTRVDGHLVPDYLGTPFIIAGFYFLGQVMATVSKRFVALDELERGGV
jgi:hypothetical protein